MVLVHCFLLPCYDSYLTDEHISALINPNIYLLILWTSHSELILCF